MSHIIAKKDSVLEIKALSYGPYGIGRSEGQVIFVPLTAPGDKIEARIVEPKKNYAVGELIRLVQPSPARQVPACPHFTVCGGCHWQHVRYSEQLAAKEKIVVDALGRIGKLKGFDLQPIVPSPREYRYRRRIRLQIDSGKRLGFYRAATHDLVEIASCTVAVDSIERSFGFLREWVQNLTTPVNQVELVTGDEPGELVAVGKSDGEFAVEDETLCSSLVSPRSNIDGLVLLGPGWRKAWGRTKISLGSRAGVSLTSDADAFTQVSREGNESIVDTLLDMGEFNEQDRILELYSGAGNFTLHVAKRVRAVVAVEGHGPAIRSGELNAQVHGISNIRWIHSAVPEALRRLKSRHERFTKIVIDPPRSGAKGLERALAVFGAEKLLYVSCNPATLARDLAALTQQGYVLRRVRPIDLFPQTFHVETLAELVRRRRDSDID